LALDRPVLSFSLCNILPLTLQIDQKAGRAPEPVSTQWRENATLPPLGIESRIPSRPACCVASILRCPLRSSTCQVHFSLRKTGFASRTVRAGFEVEKRQNESCYSLSYFFPRQLSFHKSFSVLHQSLGGNKIGLPYATVLQRK
jgi:hypothetical protein